MQSRQAQHREAQVKAGEGISLAKGNRQEAREPQAPPPRTGGGRSGQGSRQADAQGRVRPTQEAGEQHHRQAKHQGRRQLSQDREAGDHLTAEGIQDQPSGLQKEIAQAHHQQEQQTHEHGYERPAGEGGQGALPQLLTRCLLPEAPTTAQLLKLQRQAKTKHQSKGQALEEPAPQDHRHGIELGEPLRLDHQARQEHQQTQHQGGACGPTQEPPEALNRYLHKLSRSLAETRQHNRWVKPQTRDQHDFQPIPDHQDRV